MKSRIFLSFHKKVTLITFIGLSLWIAGIVITPILANREEIFFQKIASFMHFFYQPVCHQIANRSFLIDGFTMTVCVRCFAFYFGGLFITIFYLFKDKMQMWSISTYILLALPALFDFLIEKFRLYSNITELRFLTGLLFGAVLFHLLLVSLSTKKVKPVLHHSKTPNTQ